MSTQATVKVLGPEDHGREVSYEDFAEAEFVEPWTYEREEGRLVVMSPGGHRHKSDSLPWRRQLSRYWIENPEIVEDVFQGAWVRDRGRTDRVGDFGVYLVPSDFASEVPDRVPDIMFEVVSPGRASRERDYVKKRREYYRLGIREYVVIDRFKKTVTVFTPGSRGYRKRVLTRTATYTTTLLPGLAIRLAEVF